MSGWSLGAAESLVLRDGDRADAVDALRLAVTELVVRGAARVEEVPVGRRGRRTEWRISRVRPSGADAPPSVVSVDRALDRLLDGPAPVSSLAQTLVGGASAKVWLREIVVAGLVDRGVLAPERTKALGLVPRTRVAPTAAGVLERERLLAHLAALSALSDEDHRDPRPVLVAAGASVLLVRETWGRLADTRPGPFPVVADAGGTDGWDQGAELPDLDALGDGLVDGLDAAFDGIGADLGGVFDGGGADGGGGGGDGG